MTQLGLVGGLVNAHTNGKYLDDPDFSVVWERAAGLGVPLYLDPAKRDDRDDPHPAFSRSYSPNTAGMLSITARVRSAMAAAQGVSAVGSAASALNSSA